MIVVNSESARYANGISKSQRTVTFVSHLHILSIYPFLDIYTIYLLFLSSFFFFFPPFFRLQSVRQSRNLASNRYGGYTRSASPPPPFIYDFVDTEACTVDGRREKSQIGRGGYNTRNTMARSVARWPAFCGRKRLGRVCPTVIEPTVENANPSDSSIPSDSLLFYYPSVEL